MQDPTRVRKRYRNEVSRDDAFGDMIFIALGYLNLPEKTADELEKKDVPGTPAERAKTVFFAQGIELFTIYRPFVEFRGETDEYTLEAKLSWNGRDRYRMKKIIERG